MLVNYPRAMRVPATVVVALIAVAIAGCGGDEDTATSGPTETTTSEPVPQSSSEHARSEPVQPNPL